MAGEMGLAQPTYVLYGSASRLLVSTWFCLVMEAYQFAHDAAACDAWLQQQSSLMEAMPLDACKSVVDAEQLLRRLDGMEKAAVPWEDRFNALQKLTEVC